MIDLPPPEIDGVRIVVAKGDWRHSGGDCFTWDTPDDGMGWVVEYDVECPSCEWAGNLVIPVGNLFYPCPDCGEAFFGLGQEDA